MGGGRPPGDDLLPRAEIDVLIVDTLDRCTGLRGDAENAAGAVNEAMEPLQVAAAAGLAVPALSHQRESSGESGAARPHERAPRGGAS